MGASFRGSSDSIISSIVVPPVPLMLLLLLILVWPHPPPLPFALLADGCTPFAEYTILTALLVTSSLCPPHHASPTSATTTRTYSSFCLHCVAHTTTYSLSHLPLHNLPMNSSAPSMKLNPFKPFCRLSFSCHPDRQINPKINGGSSVDPFREWLGKCLC